MGRLEALAAEGSAPCAALPPRICQPGQKATHAKTKMKMPMLLFAIRPSSFRFQLPNGARKSEPSVFLNFDDLVKSRLKRHPGESRGPEHIKKLDSGFRRNDKFYGISTFYEFINFIRSPSESTGFSFSALDASHPWVPASTFPFNPLFQQGNFKDHRVLRIRAGDARDTGLGFPGEPATIF
jgi:hypothetical protein